MEYFEEPVTLPCGHSFCRPCLVGTAKSATGPKCPSCRAPFPHPALPPVNLMMTAIADKIVAGQQEQLDRRLALAVRDCRAARVDGLLSRGASAKAPGPEGVEGLKPIAGLLNFCTWQLGEHRTASGARIAVALIRAGAVPFAVDLCNACIHSRVPEWAAVALEMVRHGASPTYECVAVDGQKATALSFALGHLQAPLSLALIAAGAAVNGKLGYRSFVKHAAEAKLHAVVVAMLDKGAKVDHKDEPIALSIGRAWLAAHPASAL